MQRKRCVVGQPACAESQWHAVQTDRSGKFAPALNCLSTLISARSRTYLVLSGLGERLCCSISEAGSISGGRVCRSDDAARPYR
jgi:hypothetical protein